MANTLAAKPELEETAVSKVKEGLSSQLASFMLEVNGGVSRLVQKKIVAVLQFESYIAMMPHQSMAGVQNPSKTGDTKRAVCAFLQVWPAAL